MTFTTYTRHCHVEGIRSVEESLAVWGSLVPYTMYVGYVIFVGGLKVPPWVGCTHLGTYIPYAMYYTTYPRYCHVEGIRSVGESLAM